MNITSQIYKMDTTKRAGEQTMASTFISGFLMQFINPKVVLFTMTVIPSFILPYYTAPSMLTLFVICAIVLFSYSTILCIKILLKNIM